MRLTRVIRPALLALTALLLSIGAACGSDESGTESAGDTMTPTSGAPTSDTGRTPAAEEPEPEGQPAAVAGDVEFCEWMRENIWTPVGVTGNETREDYEEDLALRDALVASAPAELADHTAAMHDWFIVDSYEILQKHDFAFMAAVWDFQARVAEFPAAVTEAQEAVGTHCEISVVTGS